MHFRSIFYVLGYALAIVGLFMLLPLLVALLYREKTQALVFLICALINIAVGFLLTRIKRPASGTFTVKDGYVSVALCWIVISLLGAVPFTVSGEIPSYLNAVFETVSGFTTTGASILNDVEVLSHSMLFWRSFTHWLGGMGVLVFLLMLLPMSDSGSSFALMQAESPGPSVSKLVPRLRMAAGSLYAIYLGLTVLETIFLLFGHMPLFDALCLTFGTMGTGGFGLLNASIGSYSAYIQWVIIIFMMLAGTDFALYFLLLRREWGTIGKMEEVRWFYVIIAAVTLLICLNLLASGLFGGVREVLFQVTSIMTTTGYATADFDAWPLFSKNLLVLLMFVGGCSGSTGGGMKVSRMMIYCKAGVQKIRQLARPRAVRTVRMNGKKLDDSVIQGALLFLVCYALVFIGSLFIISLEPIDFTTAFTSVASMLNNIGPGLNLVGPTCNYEFFHPLSKLVFMFDMLAGRLGVFPILILFSYRTWHK